jgi:hypothetical protein
MALSWEMKAALKLSPRPLYHWAKVGGWTRSDALSRLIHDARPVGQQDVPKLEKIAAELGVRRPFVKGA